MIRWCAVLMFAASLAGGEAVCAQDAPSPVDTGQAAFERRDFAAAAELWREEADRGSGPAKLGLGLLNDLGLGVPRDSAKALRWYLEAADAGVPEAEFNVGVMLDAGTGVPRDAVGAAIWYARAAANGHHRGEYNLGLVYQSGEGVPVNPDLARFWLGRAAATLPAAAQRLATAPASEIERRLVAPDLLAAGIVRVGNGHRVELVWTSSPIPKGAYYLVELARLPEAGTGWGEVPVSVATEGSALAVALPGSSGRYGWRVATVQGTHYAVAGWQAIDGDAQGLPSGWVTLLVAPDDAPAHRLATELEASFRQVGLWVRVVEAPATAATTGVRYAFAEDAGLAGQIAEFLPFLRSSDAVLTPKLQAAPGEVVVQLVGGPAE